MVFLQWGWQVLTTQLVEEGTRLEEALAAAHLSMAQVTQHPHPAPHTPHPSTPGTQHPEPEARKPCQGDACMPSNLSHQWSFFTSGSFHMGTSLSKNSAPLGPYSKYHA